MALITYTNKDDTQPEGDPRKHYTDDDANEVKSVVNTNRGDSDSSLSTLTSNLSSHTGNTSNPHSVTKTQVGLDQVDNTSDANKPVSTAQAAADALKANIASPTFTGVPAGPTASPGTTTTQFATTAFVAAAATASADAKVTNTITNGLTTVAPAQDIVFDTFALKANSADIPLLTSFVENEVPSGSINSSNTAYTIANTPVTGSVKVYWNGMRMKVGVGYTISGVTITMTLPPDTGDTLVCDYRK